MSPIKMQKIEAALRAAIAFNKAVNAGDISKLNELISDECIYESPNSPPDGIKVSGKKNVIRFWEEWFEEHPGWQFSPQEVYGMGSKSILYWRMQYSSADDEELAGKGRKVSRKRESSNKGENTSDREHLIHSKHANDLHESGLDVVTVSSGKISDIRSFMKGQFKRDISCMIIES